MGWLFTDRCSGSLCSLRAWEVIPRSPPHPPHKKWLLPPVDTESGKDFVPGQAQFSTLSFFLFPSLQPSFHFFQYLVSTVRQGSSRLQGYGRQMGFALVDFINCRMKGINQVIMQTNVSQQRTGCLE